MLTNFVLGLWPFLGFVSYGVPFRFGPLWISNPLVEFSSVHAGSWLLLCLCTVCVAQPLPGGIVCAVGCGYTLVWVLQLSCFGYFRAKNNSELPCGLELCFIFCLGLSPIVFAFITEP